MSPTTLESTLNLWKCELLTALQSLLYVKHDKQVFFLLTCVPGPACLTCLCWPETAQWEHTAEPFETAVQLLCSRQQRHLRT